MRDSLEIAIPHDGRRDRIKLGTLLEWSGQTWQVVWIRKDRAMCRRVQVQPGYRIHNEQPAERSAAP